MTDILREVDEAMRAERMKLIWQQHGTSILVIAGGIILGTAVHSGYSAYKNHQARAQTAALMEALHTKTPADSLAELTKSLKGGGKALAGLDAADQALASERYDDAITLYDLVAADQSVPADMRDLAVVQSTSVKLDHAPTAKADDLIAALAPIAASDKSVWKARALFLSAVIKANRQNNYKAALDDLALASVVPNLPSSFEVQIKALQQVYQLKTANSPDAAPANSAPQPAKE